MFYKIVKTIVKPYLWIRFKIKVIGIENIPTKGSLIIASNHISNFDPIILTCLIERKIHFLAKAELFKYRLTKWFFKKIHAIPVNRHSGIAIHAVRQSISVLKDEKVLGIFPEGTRCRNGKKSEPKKGVGFFAEKCKSPIIPIALIGMDKIKGLRCPITVAVGKVIDIEDLDSSNYLRISKLVMEEISVMKNSMEIDHNELIFRNDFNS
jgi:1-acyl-sn-glycerol-3-phosphate acyltransferase